MDDLYQILGVQKTASQDDIKSAYRKLASKHHPDKGGDTAIFQKIQNAYNVLGDPDKRSEYDNPRPQMGGFEFNGGVPPGFEDIFRHFGGGGPFGGFEQMFGRRQPQRRNHSLNLGAEVTLEEAFHGKELIANVRLPSGKEQIINVRIPPGVNDGTTLRLSEMGDDSIPNIPRGDLHLSIHVRPHSEYERQGDDLIKIIDISALDAILGTTIDIRTLDGKILNVNIPEGTQPNKVLGLQGHGMPNMNDSRFRGRLLLRINVTIPSNLTERQKDLIRQAKN